MTKPQCSKENASPPEPQKNPTEAESNPKTAKDLFSVFAPDEEDDSSSNEQEQDDSEEINVKNIDRDHNYEPTAKKIKDKDTTTSSTKKYAQKYKKEWETKPELKPWLSESIHGSIFFYCKFCKNDYRGGISDIHKHMSSKKHMLKNALPAFKAQKFKFRGLLCPVFTPFHALNSRKAPQDVNIKAIQTYANYLNACNVKGILINDIMGEGMSLTVRERFEVTDAWASICEKNNQFLMVQVGGAPFKDVIEMAKHAEKKKEVGAIVILPDLYCKPKNHLDLIKYLKAISEHTKQIPLLYHHSPHFTNVEIDVPSLLLDITGEIDSFVGLIYSTNNIQKVSQVVAVNPERFTIFIGTDDVILGAVATGLTCVMSTSLNYLPKLVESIYSSVKAEKIKNAQKSQNLLNRTLELLRKEGDSIVVFKTATEIITNTCGVGTREPLHPLWEGTVKKLHGKLHEIGVV